MSLLSALEPPQLHLIILGVAGAVIAGVAAWSTHQIDDSAYSKLAATFSEYKATVATQDAKGEGQARIALQASVDRANSAETRNGQLETALQTSQAQVLAANTDAEFARRLLNAAAQQAAASASGHSGGGGSPGGSVSAGSTTASGNRSTPDLLGDVAGSATECRDAIERLYTLQLEIVPQLKK